jgi:hypothetical protein
MATNIGQTPPASGVYIDMTTGATQSGHTQFRNRIINGDMRIDQRNSGTQTTINFGNAGTYIPDRWNFQCTGYTAGQIYAQQLTDVPSNSGHINSLRYLVNTGFTGSGYTWGFRQSIEGYNIRDFMQGTTNAVSFTLSFWTKTNVTGLHSVVILSGDFVYRYFVPFTVTNSGVWEYKSIVINPETTQDARFNTTNSAGMVVCIYPYQPSAPYVPVNYWLSVAIANSVNVPNAVNWLSTANNYVMVTGVQLEKGPKATPFEFRPFAIELPLCMRYFQYITNWHGIVDSSTAIGINAQLIVPLRTSPSTVDKISGSTLNFRSANADNSTTTWTLYAPTGTTTSVWFQANTISGVTLPTAGSYIHYRHGIATSIATVNAEL